MVVEKQCGGCNMIKKLDDFHKQKLGKYGRRATCKQCRFLKEGEKTRLRLQKYREEDAEKMKAYKREQYHKHKDRRRVSERKRLYNYEQTQEAKIKKLHRKHKRRIIERHASDGTIPIKVGWDRMTTELKTMLDAQDNKCNICECSVSHDLGNLHLDHVKPISKGGLHSITNVQWLCASCNLSKGDIHE